MQYINDVDFNPAIEFITTKAYPIKPFMNTYHSLCVESCEDMDGNWMNPEDLFNDQDCIC